MFLHFNRFDVQDSSGCSNDSVSLKDTATGIELFKLCGNKSPSDVMSLNNEMTVVFASDSSVKKNGFVISYMPSREVFGKQYEYIYMARWFLGIFAIFPMQNFIYISSVSCHISINVASLSSNLV